MCCRGTAIRARLQAVAAGISRQEAMEDHERAASLELMAALGAQARETESKALVEHEAAMAAMLAAQEAQVGALVCAASPGLITCLWAMLKSACSRNPST